MNFLINVLFFIVVLSCLLLNIDNFSLILLLLSFFDYILSELKNNLFS